ncbi:hypothetical protein BKA82DRAFT_966739, partial [Pisolithus tinctorius]
EGLYTSRSSIPTHTSASTWIPVPYANRLSGFTVHLVGLVGFCMLSRRDSQVRRRVLVSGPHRLLFLLFPVNCNKTFLRPHHLLRPNSSHLHLNPAQNRFRGPSLEPQPTGLVPQPTGCTGRMPAPFMPQMTGFVDPRL